MASEFDVEGHITNSIANRNSLDDPWHRYIKSGDAICPNPDCNLAWHGLPRSQDGCPGSFHFTNRKVILKKSTTSVDLPADEEDWMY